ncbi:MAG: ATP-binding cassette domain-containing protein [Boseongicola sp.]|nr:ATP-binding cassette domain-containing protein [Boseongicola sp.]MDE0694845.1 ATP-binding cassette domain-containing protein [Boseongicola sp.]
MTGTYGTLRPSSVGVTRRSFGGSSSIKAQKQDNVPQRKAERRCRLVDVTKSFGTVNVVPLLNLFFDEGEFVVIVGFSGRGDSTALRMIPGLEPATTGTKQIAGKDVACARPRTTPSRRRNCSAVHLNCWT